MLVLILLASLTSAQFNEVCNDDGLDVDISFLGTVENVATDAAAEVEVATMAGSAELTADGIVFDAQGSYVSLPNFGYAESGGFTLSFWITKEECSEGIYEYVRNSSKMGENKKVVYFWIGQFFFFFPFVVLFGLSFVLLLLL